MEIMGRTEPLLHGHPPNPIVIATVLVHHFFIYLKMNLRGMVAIWGEMVGKLKSMQRKSVGVSPEQKSGTTKDFPAL